MDIESAMNEIGSFGPWQLWIFSWLFFMTIFTSAINTAIVFLIEIPDFVCIQNVDFTTEKSRELTFHQMKEISCPIDREGNFDCCMTYRINNTSGPLPVNHSYGIGMEIPVEKCNGPWAWNFVAMHNTAVTQWSLICEKSLNIANMQFVYMLGFFVACCTFGFLADKFGRRTVAAVSFTVAGIIGIVHSWVPNFYLFLVVRFFLGVFASGGKQCTYVLAMELCNQKFRKVMGAVFFVSYSVGYALLAPVAYVARDWRIMHVFISVPLCTGILLFWTVPESPRWLVAKKRFQDAENVFEWAAKWNKKKVISHKQMELKPEKNGLLHENIESETSVQHKEYQKISYLTIFSHLKLVIRTLNIFFNWFVNALVYYGISLLITSFSGNIFINNAISGALETPAYLLCYPLLFWARKKSLMILLILSGISGLLYLTIPTDVQWAQLLLAFCGKLCITASFNMVYIVTVELYPTPIRGASLLVSSMIGRVGSIVAPYIALIAQTNKSLMAIPMVIFGASALLAGFLTFFIPETQGQPLPETLDDILHYPPKKNDQEQDLAVHS